MKIYRRICALLIVVAVMCSIPPATLATRTESPPSKHYRATGNFSFDIPAGMTGRSSTTLPLDDGDTIVIQAAFTPPSASMDFGIVAPNGQFYHVNVTGGIADIAIDITRRGNYTFAIRNNSSSPVTVSGYINY